MSKKNNTTETITFTIEKNIAVLRTSPAGWTRELNIVKWGDREPAFDVRDWNPGHTKMSKGLSFTADELKALAEAVNGMAKSKAKGKAKKAEPVEEQVEMPETKGKGKGKGKAAK